MDDSSSAMRQSIVDKLSKKAALTLQVYNNTFSVFNELKDTLHEMSTELSDALEELGQRKVRIEYRDRGKFEAQLQVADEILIFSMHTNVFEFNHEHAVWENPYVKESSVNSHCGMVNIYNFLADSFKYNRSEDEGYLIGRFFVNHQKSYFFEGKPQVATTHDRFGDEQINRASLIEIVEAAISYALDFDLLVPPYQSVKIASVDQFNTKMENAKLQTGKRLGYSFDWE